MITPLPSFKKGQKLSALDLQTLTDAVRANRLLPGNGIRIAQSPNGTTIAAVPPSGLYSGLTLHAMPLALLAPDPFTLLQRALDDVLELFQSALPSAEKVASTLSSVLLSAISNGIPSAAAIADAVFKLLSSAFSGSFFGGGNPISQLLSGLTSHLPDAASLEDTLLSLFADAFDLLSNITEFIDAQFQKYVHVGENITRYFAQTKTSPRPGDYIYTEESGIAYTLFPVNAKGHPSTNLIFRVHFKIGKEPDANEPDTRQLWCAMTTFPAPDLGALCRMIAGILHSMLGQVLSTAAAIAAAAPAAALGAVGQVVGNTGDGISQGAATALSTWIQTMPVTDAISSSGETIFFKTVTPAWYGSPVFTYIPIVGADGQAHTAGVFGDVAAPISTSHNIVYIGSDGQTWTVPSLFQSTQIPLQTERANHNFIDPLGQSWTGDIIVFTGSLRQQNDLVQNISYIDKNWGVMEMEVLAINPPVTTTERCNIITLEACDNGKPRTLEVLNWA